MSTVFYGYTIEKAKLFPFCKKLREMVICNDLYLILTAREPDRDGIVVQVFETAKLPDSFVIRVCGMGYGFMNQDEKWADFVTPYWYDDRASLDDEEEEAKMLAREPVLSEIDDLIRERQYLLCPLLTKEEADFILYENKTRLRYDREKAKGKQEAAA